MYINKTYKSVVSIKQLPQKIKIVLNDRDEANAFLKDKIFVSYTVYAPAAKVEIDGVISINDVIDMDIMLDLISVGKGQFGNPRMGRLVFSR